MLATKGDKQFYISNTEPFIWAPDIKDAKVYSSRYSAEYDVTENYKNYISLSSQLSNGTIDKLYVIVFVDGKELERYSIL